MAKLIVSLQAELDTSTIVATLAGKAGAAVAERYRRDFEELFERLMMFPMSGARRPLLSRYARIGVVAPYIVVYDIAVRLCGFCECSTAVGTSVEGLSGND